jgi:hypothetical protein
MGKVLALPTRTLADGDFDAITHALSLSLSFDSSQELQCIVESDGRHSTEGEHVPLDVAFIDSQGIARFFLTERVERAGLVLLDRDGIRIILAERDTESFMRTLGARAFGDRRAVRICWGVKGNVTYANRLAADWFGFSVESSAPTAGYEDGRVSPWLLCNPSLLFRGPRTLLGLADIAVSRPTRCWVDYLEMVRSDGTLVRMTWSVRYVKPELGAPRFSAWGWTVR